jgi:succinate dehydrogenase/fumarate reductase flavoprotein subunit
MSEQRDTWDVEADVVVLGSGGAALVAALSAHHHGAGDVVVLEKSGMVGGTTAMSGGMLWIPLNHHQAEHGVEDSLEEVVAYLDAMAPERLDPDTVSGFLEGGPEMVRFLADHTPVRLRLFTGFPDYQPNLVGAKAHGGRSLDPEAYPFDELGNAASRVNPPKSGPPKLTSRMEDYYHEVGPEELEERRKHDYRGQGQALIGSLYKGVLDREIPLHFDTRARQLCTEGSRIVGVVAEQGDRTIRFGARKGVIICTGGFEWNEQLVKSFLRGPMTGPISVPECEGDGLLMAMEVGASLGNMSNAWWMTSSKESSAGHRDTRASYLPSQVERTFPGSIMVNRAGRRFVNEALNYNALGYVLHNFDADKYEFPNLPYWLIFDSRFLAKYRVFTSRPGDPAPAWATAADTLEELGALVGINGPALADTVEQFNGFVGKGHDDDFGRGDATYDNFWGDQAFEPPFATLGVIDQPPYYAIKMEPGVNGTCGGPRANEHAQVLDWDGNPIPGLYVGSNTMAAVTAGGYGGAGGTIGPGMTFGYLAGRHAARQPAASA